MKKAKLNINRLPDAQVIQQCNNINNAVKGNANFPKPDPTAEAFQADTDDAAAKLTAAENAKVAYQKAIVDKNAAIQKLKDSATLFGNYVEITTGGDESKILSAGMGVRGKRSAVTIEPARVENLSLTAGDRPGQLDIQWDPTANGKRYEVEIGMAMDFATGTVRLPSVSKSKTVVKDLTMGTRYWARVRALNAVGAGPWSDVATKVTPQM